MAAFRASGRERGTEGSIAAAAEAERKAAFLTERRLMAAGAEQVGAALEGEWGAAQTADETGADWRAEGSKAAARAEAAEAEGKSAFLAERRLMAAGAEEMGAALEGK
jgi:hypothetical protein